ncbi:MAG: NVEALA domain-containing protein [Bacteroidaceae bacterium]|nr:NVEALA domain-containing protein [Bacteroidaceae bacterium]
MKKKFLTATFVVAIMAVAGFNVYMNQAKSEMSELALANIEALAKNEEGEVKTCGTKEKPFSPYTCGMCGCESGMDGIFYSKTTGNDTSYKYGFEGKQLYCCCNGHPAVYSKAETRKCTE